MGKKKEKKVCLLCQKEYELSKKDEMLRKIASQFSVLNPLLKAQIDVCDNYCNECYKQSLIPIAENQIKEAKTEENLKS